MNPSYFQPEHLSFSSSFPQRPAVAGHGGARRPDTGVWPCTLDGCTKVFAREADLKRHQRTTKSHSIPGSSTGSPCPLCDATFTRSDAMRRHLKSRHGGKTPETLTQADMAAAAAAAAASPGSRGKRRATSPQEDEESGSEGEGRSHPAPQRTTTSTSRAPSAAPPYYNPHQHPNHAPPPPNVPPPPSHHPGTVNSNLSPAILYQAAMSYEIRHALSPRPSSSTTSSPTMASAVPVPRHVPPPPPPPATHATTQTPSHHNTGTTHSRRGDHQYPQPPMAPGYQQFPPDDYYGGPSSGPSGPPFPPYEPPQTYTTSSSSGGSSYSGYSRTPYVAPPTQARAYATGGGGKDSGGLQALAMHAAQIRPMSPLASKGGHSQGQGKTKSELESALGVPYGR